LTEPIKALATDNTTSNRSKARAIHINIFFARIIVINILPVPVGCQRAQVTGILLKAERAFSSTNQLVRKINGLQVLCSQPFVQN
jgi:hypothetical protein